MSAEPASGRVVSVQIGRVARLDDAKRSPSAFIKRPVAAPLRAGERGLDGDEQADHSVHGGPDKAIYIYAHTHYARWREIAPHHAARLAETGAFAENLTITGFTEDEVAIGDRFQAGAAVLEVSEPRQPCFKFAHVFQDRTLGRTMLRTGMTGWYTRVLRPGAIGAGDAFTLIDRPHPAWTIRRITGLLTGKGMDDEVAADLLALTPLSATLRDQCAARLRQAPA